MDQFLPRFRAPNLDSFSFTFTRPARAYRIQVRRLILFAINKGPKTVSLNFADPNDERTPSYPWPNAFYYQPLLETLSLANCILFSQMFSNFTSLKSLSLGHTSLGDDGVVLNRILRECKTIETLTLQSVCAAFDACITISSEKLKSLTLEDCQIAEFEFRTPSLTFFKYHGRLLEIEEWAVHRIFVFHQESIGEMDLNFLGTPCNGRTLVGDLTRKHLSALRWQMKSLKVCSFTLQSLSKGHFIGLRLNIGIKDLTIETSFHDQELDGLFVLLRGCPYLVRLTIIIVGEENVCTAYLPPLDEISRELDLNCIQNSVEKVSVHGYKGSKRENKFLKYLTKKAKYMQELVIRCYSKRVHRKLCAHGLQGVESPSRSLRITVK